MDHFTLERFRGIKRDTQRERGGERERESVRVRVRMRVSERE